MNTFLHTRNFCQGRIRPWVGKPVIKVLTGMRRVGKSCVLRQTASLVRAAGLAGKQILFVDKEDVSFDDIRNHRHLAAWIRAKAPAGRAALLVDEVQEIEGWERVVNSCLKEGRFDIYVTGSNARMLSSDLATLLSGRYVEIPIFPLNTAATNISPRCSFLCDAFVFRRVRRFDLRGKRHLEINEKYYPGDIGLRHAVLGYRQDAINGMLETVVLQELVRRGFTVSVGKLGTKEIDFVADRGRHRGVAW